MTSPIGIFGKIPAVGDFVSMDAASPTCRTFQDWLQAENDYLAKKGKTLPGNVRFIYRDASAGGVLVGGLGPSRDQVGRSFPLAVFTEVEAHVAMPKFSALPTAYDPFLDGVATAVAECHQMQLQDLRTRTANLHLAGAKEVRDAQLWTREALEATPAVVILETLFGPLAHGVAFHGANMFRTGCAQVPGADPGKANIVLECPAHDDVQVAFWLSLAEGLLRWSVAPPTIMWTTAKSPDARVLIALGGAPLGLLHFLADPTAVAERLWPMTTTAAASIDAGRRAASPGLRTLLEHPPATAATLVDGLMRG